MSDNTSFQAGHEVHYERLSGRRLSTARSRGEERPLALQRKGNRKRGKAEFLDNIRCTRRSVAARSCGKAGTKEIRKVSQTVSAQAGENSGRQKQGETRASWGKERCEGIDRGEGPNTQHHLSTTKFLELKTLPLKKKGGRKIYRIKGKEGR